VLEIFSNYKRQQAGGKTVQNSFR